MIFRGLLFAVAIVLMTGCGSEGVVDIGDAELNEQSRLHRQEIFAWREDRLTRLQAADGWLSLVGLHWLEPNQASFIGSGLKNGIRFDSGPVRLGFIRVQGKKVTFKPEPGVDVLIDGKSVKSATELVVDSAGSPTKVSFNKGDASFTVIERGGRLALRVRDALASTRTQFEGIDYFDINPLLRITGKFVPHPPGKTITIVNIMSMEEEMVNSGVLSFEHEGKQFNLETIDEGDGRLFITFADRTSGHESYSAARFIYAETPAADGTVVIDFNKTYNPPCAYTPFSTCPLPPQSNRMDMRINAGEMKPRKRDY